MAVPPGVSERDFERALSEFEDAVGEEWVFTSDEDVDLYRDAYSIYKGEPEDRVASAAVAPYTVQEVQAVVRTANRYRIPIYPISTGKNLGYGGSAPNLSGSVVLDLKHDARQRTFGRTCQRPTVFQREIALMTGAVELFFLLLIEDRTE